MPETLEKRKHIVEDVACGVNGDKLRRMVRGTQSRTEISCVEERETSGTSYRRTKCHISLSHVFCQLSNISDSNNMHFMP